MKKTINAPVDIGCCSYCDMQYEKMLPASLLQFHRTRIFRNDVFASALWRGWQNPVSCDDVPALCYLDCFCDLQNRYVAREGLEQRVVPTCVATGDNEMSYAPEFQQKAFSESGCLQMNLDGYGKVQ